MADPETDNRRDSTISSAKTAPFRPRRRSARARVVRDEQHLRRGRARSRGASGRSSPASSNGRARGTRCSTGSRRMRSGSSAAQLNASVNCLDRHVRGPRRNKAAHHLGRRARRSPHADLLRSLSRGLGVRQRAQVARRQEGRSRRHLPAARARAGRSRCSPARASARSTASSSAASAPSRCAIASTTPSAACSSPPTAATAAARSSPLKQIADEAVAGTPSIEHVVVVQRGGGRAIAGHA